MQPRFNASSLQPLCVADLFHSSQEFVRVREHSVFETLIIGHRHIFLRYAKDRRVELIKNVFLDPIANFRTHAAEGMILFNYHYAMRFSYRIENRILIERLD